MELDALTRVSVVFALAVFGSACGSAQEEGHHHATDTAAYVGDRRITEADLDAAWRERKPGEYARAQESVYRMRRAVLNDLIADALVADEVARQNRPEPQLVTLAVESGAVTAGSPVDENEIAELYEQSGAAEYGIQLDVLRPDLVKAIEEQRAVETLARYRDHLRANGDVRVFLDAPRRFVPVAPSDPVRGAPDARVRIIEFSDFRCPFCRRIQSVLDRLFKEYADQVQWIWKDYPLGSSTAALAAACAHEQSRFWIYHDALFDRQDETFPDEVAAVQALAGEVGLDEQRFAECLADQRYTSHIAADVAAGKAAGVAGTPTVFINGRMIVGARSFETYQDVVLDELGLN